MGGPGGGPTARRWYTNPIIEFFDALHLIDPIPKLTPPASPADGNGFIMQADLPADRGVGFIPIERKDFKSTGRFIQGF